MRGEAVNMGIAFIKVASVYLLIGVSLGLYMGMADKFQYTPVHAHVNLLAWATMALFGLIYYYFPRAGDSILGKVHFWLHNIGTVALLIGMILFANGNESAGLPFAIPGAWLVIIGVVIFIINVFKNVKKEVRF
ncbi:cytochrome-c oxidase [Planococcus sp. N028]|uniref:Cytochrome-c oxidase n=1 Tax=Planococcus shixiaomingii TaxID=3058393 RepID=A0ABT8N3J1_9BACL|nr:MULTISPECIES: cytochrome-c oxidase [unclassified Planococcus (in: firmicutes)]MDN7242440.1 cytochrome-c oxidase [Planococcus sp. N028]WKA54681.1 cytochrome-c oxidase [Planococcus sp. N022]